MLRTYAPAAVAILAIIGLTVVEANFSDRFSSSSMTAEEFGKFFANVPKQVGPWVGVDMKEEQDTLKMAGAVSHVSRRYTNSDSGHSVDLWLIVGHSRDICRHTPDICYPSQGYSQIGARVKQEIIPAGDAAHPAHFFTAKFTNEANPGIRRRVFWAWNGNEDGKYEWDAPEPKSLFSWLPVKSMGPKAYYGNNTKLYKMYFSADMASPEEPVADNVAVEFAELILPEINRALFPGQFGPAVKADAEASADASEAAAPAPTLAEPAAPAADAAE